MVESSENLSEPTGWDRLRKDLDEGMPWEDVLAEYDIPAMVAEAVDPERSDLSVEDLARISGVKEPIIKALIARRAVGDDQDLESEGVENELLLQPKDLYKIINVVSVRRDFPDDLSDE